MKKEEYWDSLEQEAIRLTDKLVELEGLTNATRQYMAVKERIRIVILQQNKIADGDDPLLVKLAWG